MSTSDSVWREQIVRQTWTPVTWLRLILVSLTVPFAAAVCLLIPELFTFAPVVLLLGGCVAWRYVRRQRVEFEYNVSEGTLDVDRVTGKRARKQLLTAEFWSFEAFAPVEAVSGEIKAGHYDVRLDASSGRDAPGRRYAVFHDNKGRRTLLVFEPNQRLLDAMRPYISRQVWPRD